MGLILLKFCKCFGILVVDCLFVVVVRCACGVSVGGLLCGKCVCACVCVC